MRSGPRSVAGFLRSSANEEGGGDFKSSLLKLKAKILYFSLTQGGRK